QRGLIGEAVPVVGRHTAVTQPRLERPRRRSWFLPTTLRFVRRDIRPPVGTAPLWEFDFGQPGLGRHIVGAHRRPPLLVLLVLLQAIELGKSNECSILRV